MAVLEDQTGLAALAVPEAVADEMHDVVSAGRGLLVQALGRDVLANLDLEKPLVDEMAEPVANIVGLLPRREGREAGRLRRCGEPWKPEVCIRR